MSEDTQERRQRLLVVEDEAEVRLLLERALQKTYDVVSATNGAEGLALAQAQSPALIVSDIMMPKMDGLELCRALGQDAALSRVPVILLTARTEIESKLEGLRLGAVDYITKPFDLRELRARIAAQLRSRNLEDALSERESRLAAIGQMTSTIAHDLRAPLTVLTFQTDLLEMSLRSVPDGVEVADGIEHMRRSLERISKMVDEMLAYAQGHEIALQRQWLPIDDFVYQVVEQLEPGLAQSNVKAETSFNANQKVYIDPARLSRAIENLATNAREALVNNPEQSASCIWFSTEVNDEGTWIEVADNGPGLPEAIKDNLFEPFTSNKVGGTGLGLTIVRNLVLAHGGRLDIASHGHHGGASMRVLIPRPEEQ